MNIFGEPNQASSVPAAPSAREYQNIVRRKLKYLFQVTWLRDIPDDNEVCICVPAHALEVNKCLLAGK